MTTYPVPVLLVVWASSIAAAGVLAWTLVRSDDWRNAGRTTLFD